jgi:galactokinase
MRGLSERVKGIFKEKFASEPHLYFSPGRINFIGEHVDYNDGFVMPAAIDKGICYAIAPNRSNLLNFYSIDFEEELSVEIRSFTKTTSWKNYVLSVVNEFMLLNKEVRGFDCAFGGNIANGAGMSSSAAVEGGLAFAINELFNFGLSRKELALLCQKAEHNFPCVNCGIMDQYANMMGMKDNVLLLDTRSVEHEYIPLNLDGHVVVLINTNVHHNLASSEYNTRRHQCNEGLDILKKEMGVSSFRDIKVPADIEPYKGKMDDAVYKRCSYVVHEIQRAQEAAHFLKSGRLEDFGLLMFVTHEGLRNLYEVSCPELDFLVDEAKKNSNVIGSRMMGGGFGGCTINLIRKESVKSFIDHITPAYQQAFHITPHVFHVDIVDGTHEIHNI